MKTQPYITLQINHSSKCKYYLNRCIIDLIKFYAGLSRVSEGEGEKGLEP